MIGTLVNDENLEMFIPEIKKEELKDTDLIVGVIDEKTDTACGVLIAQENTGDCLIIRYIYVAPDYRNRGAGTVLLEFFLEIVQKIDVKSISCSYIKEADNYYLYRLLEKEGFADESERLCEYVVRAGSFELSKSVADDELFKIISVNDALKKKKDSLPIDEIVDYLLDFSFIATDGKKILGMILFRKFGSFLELGKLEAYGENNDIVLYSLLFRALAHIRQEFSDNVRILIDANSDRVKKTLRLITDGSAIRFEEIVLFNLNLKY